MQDQGHAPDSVQDAWAELARRVEQRVGVPLPPRDALGTPAFDAVLRALREQDPALWQEVLDALTSPEARLPVEDEVLEARSRERARARLFGPFLRPDLLRTGLRRLNLRRIVNAVVIAIVLIGFFWAYTGGRRAGAPPVTPAPQQTAQASRPVAPTPPPAQPTPSPEAPAAPSAQPTPPPEAPSPPSSPPPPLEASIPLPLPPAVPGVGAAAAPPIPGAQQPEGPAGPVVFRAEPKGPGTGSPVVYRREEAREGASTTPAGGSPVVFSSAARAQGAGTSAAAAGSLVVFPVAGATQAAGGQVAGIVTPPAAPTGQNQPAAGAQPPAPAGPVFRLGQVLQTKLALPVSVSPAWGPVPALAEVTDGPQAGALLWGQARMGRDGSIEMAFTQLILDQNRILPFNGVAYDAAAGRPGVSGQVQTVAPNALQTIVGSTLQAASEYFKARVNASTVTITNGWLTIQQQQPNFWDVYSKTLAEAMTPTTQVTGPTVVARLPAGAVISVIVLGQ
jgi:hypothetical protein